MDETEKKLRYEETDYDRVSSSASNKRRTSLTESGSVFSYSRIGGKEIRIPASDAQNNIISAGSTASDAQEGTQTYSSVYSTSQVPAHNKRATISTNRVFSPYDLSFFEDPVTTRELSKSERQHISSRRNTSDSSRTTSHLQQNNIYSNAGTSVSQPRTNAATYSSPSAREIVLTPGNNIYPEDETTSSSPQSVSYSSSSNRIAAPVSNTFPPDTPKPAVSARKTPSVQNSGRITAPSESISTEDKPKPVFSVPKTSSSNQQSTTQQTVSRVRSSGAGSAAKPVFKTPSASGTSASRRRARTSAVSNDTETQIFTPNTARSSSESAAADIGSTQVFPSFRPDSSSQTAAAPSAVKTTVIPVQNNVSTETIKANSAKAARPAVSASASSSVSPDLSGTTTAPKPSSEFDAALLSMFDFPETEAAEKAAQEAIDRTNAMKTQPETPAVIYPAPKSRPAKPQPTVSSSNTAFFGSMNDRSDTEEDLGKTMVVPAGALKDDTFITSNTKTSSVLSDDATRAVDLAAIAETADDTVSDKAPVRKKALFKKASGGGGGRNTPPSGSNSSAGSSKAFRIITIILVVGVVLELLAGIIGTTMIVNMTKNSPNLNLTDFVGEESTKIYDDSGELVTEVGVYLRENVTYDKCPESLVDAFLSIEDSRFFSHFGFDIPRFTKALIDNIKTHSFGQGGSTFTMQLVKNTYFSIESMDASDTGTERTKSIEYKVQQIYLATKLEKLLSKKEIFQLYLNKLNFGGNIRGVQRASQYYFGKNSYELTLHESAMLAGIVNLPNRYNPYDYLDYGTTRRNTVLDLMCTHGYITEEQRDLAKMIKVEDTLVGDIRQATEDSQYQSYLDVVLEEAMELTGVDPTVKGMQIYTHLNREMQEQVEAIQNGETDVVYPDDLMQVAMVSMDNRTGAIVAVGGGRNYDGARLLNRATMNYKQPGSSVKPLLSYALAFEYLGYSLEEVLLDKPITYPMESMVLVNASGNYAGDVTIKDAVGNSLNIPAILTLERVVNKIGAEKVVEYLQAIGFSHVKAENFHLSYAIGGTTFETTCVELAGAHSMLINKGVYNKPHTIQKVVMTSDGSEFYPDGQNNQVLSSGSAYLATELEANNVTGPYFNYMQLLARSYPVYAKTGTTDWGNDGVQYGIPKGQMKDKWMVASTSQYTNCVWVGYDKAVVGEETYYTSYKSSLNIPGNINRLLLDKEEEIFGIPEAIPQPDDVTNSTYIYGTFPHVRPEYSLDGGGTVTALVSTTGLENQPLVDPNEFLEYAKSESEYLGTSGMSANYNQFGILNVSWSNSSGICSGGQRNIGLHDAYNDIDQWGACLADLSWLTGSGQYWGTVYIDDMPVAEISSTNGFFSGYVTDQAGTTVKVCGGSTTVDGSDNTACTIAQYIYDESLNGYLDENGNWIQLEVPEYEQYGYWDENGNWVGQGFWDANGFHLE